jgi:hypothetical protein
VLPVAVRIVRAFWLAVHEDVHATSRARAVNAFLDELFANSSDRLIGSA